MEALNAYLVALGHAWADLGLQANEDNDFSHELTLGDATVRVIHEYHDDDAWLDPEDVAVAWIVATSLDGGELPGIAPLLIAFQGDGAGDLFTTTKRADGCG
jgi:hypothetical protein